MNRYMFFAVFFTALVLTGCAGSGSGAGLASTSSSGDGGSAATTTTTVTTTGTGGDPNLQLDLEFELLNDGVGQTVFRDQHMVLAALVKITANTTTTLSSVTWQDVGVGDYNDIFSGWMYLSDPSDESSKQLYPSVYNPLSGEVTTMFAEQIEAGTSKLLWLYLTFNAPALSAGNQHSFELAKSGVVVNNETVGGSFPFETATFVVGQYQQLQLQVNVQTPFYQQPQPGTEDVDVLRLSMEAFDLDVEVKALRFFVQISSTSPHPGFVKGSLGTPYFTDFNVLLKNETGAEILFGPCQMDASTPSAATGAGVVCPGSALVKAGTELWELVIITALSPKEDAVGEFFGSFYTFYLEAFQPGDVALPAMNDSLLGLGFTLTTNGTSNAKVQGNTLKVLSLGP